MKLHSVSNCSLVSGSERPFDLLIFACGFESRCLDIFNKLIKERPTIKLSTSVLAFEEDLDNAQRKKNEARFTSYGITPDIFSQKESLAIKEWMFNELKTITKKISSPRIFVDISSMSRPWYAGIIQALRAFDSDIKIELVFGYTVAAEITNVEKYPPSEIVGPVPGFTALESPDKPTALVLSLGVHPGRGLGLREYLDPQLSLLVTSGNKALGNYLPMVNSANADLFDRIPQSDKFTCDITDPAGTFLILRSLCNGLVEEWRIVLASVGPKMVGLIFFLLAVVDPRLSVWRVSAGKKALPQDVKGIGQVYLTTTWE